MKDELLRFAKRMAVSFEKRLSTKVHLILNNGTIIILCNDLEESGNSIKQDGTAFAFVVCGKG